MERAALKAFVRSTAAPVERGERMFLSDPHASGPERVSIERMLEAAKNDDGNHGGAGWLCIRTGGSGGAVKFARHDEMTLGAAVRGFCEHFQIARVNAVGV